MENTVKKVYLVWYDNGQSYEAHQLSLCKVFSREEDAKTFVEQRNAKNKVALPSMTKEEFYAQDPEMITCIYEQFVEQELDLWLYEDCGEHYYTEEKIHESL